MFFVIAVRVEKCFGVQRALKNTVSIGKLVTGNKL